MWQRRALRGGEEEEGEKKVGGSERRRDKSTVEHGAPDEIRTPRRLTPLPTAHVRPVQNAQRGVGR